MKIPFKILYFWNIGIKSWKKKKKTIIQSKKVNRERLPIYNRYLVYYKYFLHEKSLDSVERSSNHLK